jgi:hypothetical protein
MSMGVLLSEADDEAAGGVDSVAEAVVSCPGDPEVENVEAGVASGESPEQAVTASSRAAAGTARTRPRRAAEFMREIPGASCGHGLGVVPEGAALGVDGIQALGQGPRAGVLGIGADRAGDDQLGYVDVLRSGNSRWKQFDWKPFSQFAQVSSDVANEPTTSCPGRMEVTSDPTASTKPTYSCPMGCGSPIGSAPRYGHRSDPQTQVMAVRMIASVGWRIFGSSKLSKRTSRGA